MKAFESYDPLIRTEEKTLSSVIGIANGDYSQELTDFANSRVRDKKKAYTDPLTGLKNRSFASDLLEEVFNKTDMPVSVMFLDLNDFKNVNDSYGHAEGDKTLRRFVKIVADVLPESSYFIRRGGDEFIIIDKESNPYTLKDLAVKIKEGLNNDNISVSIGFAVRSEADTKNSLLERADINMYKDKNKSKQ